MFTGLKILRGKFLFQNIQKYFMRKESSKLQFAQHLDHSVNSTWVMTSPTYLSVYSPPPRPAASSVTLPVLCRCHEHHRQTNGWREDQLQMLMTLALRECGNPGQQDGRLQCSDPHSWCRGWICWWTYCSSLWRSQSCTGWFQTAMFPSGNWPLERQGTGC